MPKIWRLGILSLELSIFRDIVAVQALGATHKGMRA